MSMGPIAGRHARTVLEHVERIVAIELRVAAEAIDLRRGLLADETAPSTAAPEPGAGVVDAQARIRAVVSPLDGDREPGPDFAAVTRLVHDGALVDLVDGADGGPRP